MPSKIAFGASALVLAAFATGCTLGGTNSLEQTALLRAGGPAGSGGVCAYYSGNRASGTRSLKEQFRRRACFSTRAACESWFYRVQSTYPVTHLRKPCR